MLDDFNILVARCGRTIGLRGYVKLDIYTDFLSTFRVGAIFRCGDMLFTVEDFREHQKSVKFVEIADIDSAKRLTFLNVYTTRQNSVSSCHLNDDEFFWFDIVGLNVVDDGFSIGKVIDVERIGSVDYLLVEPHTTLISNTKLPRSFFIPFINRYILDVDIQNSVINTTEAFGILERS